MRSGVSSLFLTRQHQRHDVTLPLWRQIDHSRHLMGKMLDVLGFGPIETPPRIVLREPAMTVKAYGDVAATAPTILLVPAPIKRGYIWDLVPQASVVQQCLRSGLRVYMAQWEAPCLREEEFGLAEYADRLILDCLEAVEADSGQSKAFLAGHSLGGTLASIFCALHPERVCGLVLPGAPLHFGPDAGTFGPLVRVAPESRLLASALGNVPGSFLDAVSVLADPMTFQWSRWLDWLASLPCSSKRQIHLLVERWTLDELPMPAHLFEEVVELLYRDDRFMRGRLSIRGRRALPVFVEAPLISVVDPLPYRPAGVRAPVSQCGEQSGEAAALVSRGYWGSSPARGHARWAKRPSPSLAEYSTVDSGPPPLRFTILTSEMALTPSDSGRILPNLLTCST